MTEDLEERQVWREVVGRGETLDLGSLQQLGEGVGICGRGRASD
jgi:hypothetical protein